MIGIRFALYANLMLLFGLPLFGLYALRATERHDGHVLPLRAMVAVLSLVAVGLSLLSIVAMTASMAGVALSDVDWASVQSMINDTSMGKAWQVRLAALMLTLVAALVSGALKRAWWLVPAVALSGTALGSLAWTGHGAAGEGTQGSLQLVADLVHMLAAGAWVGALAALLWLVTRRIRAATSDHLQLVHRVLHGFSLVGSIVVALIVASGLANSWVLVGPANFSKALDSVYGQLLFAKLVLFVAMLGLAAANRYGLTPAFAAAIARGNSAVAMAHLRRSLASETALACLVLALVAWLGTLQPPAAM